MKVMYGLRIIGTDKLLEFNTTSNCGNHFAVSVEFELDINGEAPWLTESKEQAEHVALNDTPWHNANHSTPTHGYVGKLEVVEIKMTW